MKKKVIIAASTLLLTIVICTALIRNKMHSDNVVAAAVNDSSKAAKQYKKYCSGCHGAQMATFVNHRWKDGKTAAAVFKAVKYGYPQTGMPAFDVTFTDQETWALADYLISGISRQKNNAVPAKGSGTYNTELLRIHTDTIASIPDVPWCLAFLPANEILVTERSGKLFRITAQHSVLPVEGVPAVVAEGQGGLLDVLPHPAFNTNHTIYLSYSKKDKNDPDKTTTAIMKAVLEGNVLKQQQDIFVAMPYSNTRHHYGGKMVFDKNGVLFFSVGERGNEKQNPQSLSNDLGKIHRIRDDGSVPSDNPFISNKDARASIYCYGTRNPQGLAIHPQTGQLWENEHGPMGGDEINLIEPGKNYGWPVITYGINYNGTPITNTTSLPGMEQPLHFWVPSIAPSGLAFVNSSRYNGWQGNLLSGSLKFHWLSRCTMQGNIISSEESMLKSVGRLRDVKQAPDGYIYITVESPGLVLRLVPDN